MNGIWFCFHTDLIIIITNKTNIKPCAKRLRKLWKYDLFSCNEQLTIMLKHLNEVSYQS